MAQKKPTPIKGMRITCNGVIYDNILSVNRGYEYSSFSYLDDKGHECYMSFDGINNAFSISTEE